MPHKAVQIFSLVLDCFRPKSTSFMKKWHLRNMLSFVGKVCFFWFKCLKWDKYSQKLFQTSKRPHSANLSVSGVLNFCLKLKKISQFGQKVAKNYPERSYFSN